ncbi:MAG: prolipoprotein diacylglyceryl transferase, partial [Planctomycetota bacterium]|nr:prolipoprotein diacylglyceryl transferase [Planctomycetota bacterium]
MRWNLDPVLYDFGLVAIRWYGVCFVIGLFIGIKVLDTVFKGRGYPKQHGEALSLWLALGMIVFAHLVHLVFYETESLWEDPIRIVQIGEGLSSHGGTFGVIFALWLFCRRKKVSFLEYADPVCVAAACLAPWVRIGNFCNSEIVGRATDVPWGVVFERVGGGARHPSQLYEAALGFALI